MLLLLACASGPQESTLVDDLQVVAVLAEPPEAGPGEFIALETVVADPKETGFDLFQWVCMGESCETVEDSLLISPGLGAIANEDPIPLFHWTLACEPGLCDPEPTADAQALLQDLPREGVSLGLRWLYVSTREGRINPTITCDEGADFTFNCAIEGDFSEFTAVYPYATTGGWDAAETEVVPGDTSIEVSWFPNDADDPADVWVVLVDGQGGVGLWSARVGSNEG